jgi:hypothetical protein
MSLAMVGCSATGSAPATGAGTSGGGGAVTSSTSATGSGAGPTSTTSTGSATSTTTSSGGTGGAPFDAGGALTTYETGIGPIALLPGQELTECITVSLNNAAGAFVRRFRADLSQGSHHMIVYTSTATTESPTPTPCQPFIGILTGEHPVFIAQQAHAELDFPVDQNDVPVGFQIAPNQMLKIEFHMINTTTAPIQPTGKAYFDTIPLASMVTLSDIAFWGTKNIVIPPNGSADTGVLFQQAIAGTYSFAVTTHQHHLGTEMQVWYSSMPGDTSDRIVDSHSWSDPPLAILKPAISFPAGGSKGLSYECHWVNPTPNVVTFGESAATNEMCFLWHYYYPSIGFQACLDGLCF